MFASKDIFLKSSGGYQISRSVRLRSSASAYFNRTFSSGANETTSTLSLWVKRGKIGAQQTLMGVAGGGSNEADLFFDGGDTLTFASWNGGSRPLGTITTSAVFRDPSAWYHVVFVVDTSNATASNRLRLYVNGFLQTIASSSYPAQNAAWYWNGAYAHRIGAYANTLGAYFDGYLTDINFIDGQALTPASFGETDAVTGVWKPKKYAGTYGTNGFYLNFSDPSAATAAAIGKDYSGNGNNWTPNSISVTAGVTYDSMLDVPTLWADGGNGRGNYCTLNPLATSTIYTTSKANLQVSGAATSSATHYCHGTLPVSTGKWYFEVTPTDVGGGPNIYVGVKLPNTSVNNVGAINTIQNGYGYGGDGNKISSGVVAYGATYTNNDVVGVALDLDAGTIVFYKNNVSQGTAFTGLTGEFVPVIAMSVGGTARTIAAEVNFGQRPFAYTPPTGFKALNTQNLPEPTIKKGNQYFNAVTYAGNNGSKVITGLGFQPDLLWFKARATAYSHALVDAVRGRSKVLQPNLTSAEATTTSASNDVVSFDADGFTLGSAEISSSINNDSSIVSWAWKESPSAGFDIVTYTGNQTAGKAVPHSLGVAPAMIIVKARGQATSWPVYHQSLGATKWLLLNSTQAVTTTAQEWDNQPPSSTNFYVGNSSSNSNQSTTYVAYLFAEVAGFSKFGSYTGNGSTDGPFVFCGFRPRWVMIKRTDAVEQWRIFDTGRDVNLQPLGNELYPNLSNTEASVTAMDFLSNGFKQRQAVAGLNASGGTYIYAAFAEVPFRNSLAR